MSAGQNKMKAGSNPAPSNAGFKHEGSAAQTPRAHCQSKRKPAWPTHPDGTPKKMGELTPEQQREQCRWALSRLKAELESPEMRKILEEDKP